MTAAQARVDLHSHTYYSDGRCSPEELVRAAAQQGLAALAISDHDNARGSREARVLASELGLRLVPAVEFSTCWPEAKMPPGQSDVDLLGYFLDVDAPDFLKAETAGLADQEKRIGLWCEGVSRMGIRVGVDDLYALNPRYPGNLQLELFLRAKGYIGDALNGLLEPLLPTIPPAARTVEEAIRLIHQLGGAAVLAHPAAYMVNWRGKLLDKNALGKLVEMGLDGVEAYHFRVDEATRRHFIGLAQRFKLLVTGGSDEHGWPQGFPRLGNQPVGLDTLRALAARAGKDLPGLS
jgi:3',5'-nucleoside bisphosphate phosphatase